MFEATQCREVVSILEAVLFGADGACIDLGMASILTGVALFMGAVLALRVAGSFALRRLFSGLRRDRSKIAPELDEGPGLKPMPYESPIRSTGAWGEKRR